jgi:hypothetical protein
MVVIGYWSFVIGHWSLGDRFAGAVRHWSLGDGTAGAEYHRYAPWGDIVPRPSSIVIISTPV